MAVTVISIARELRDQIVVVDRAAVGVAVGEQDHVPDRPVRRHRSRRARSRASLKSVPPPWRSARMRAASASRPALASASGAQLVGLRVEGDRADEVVRPELVEHGERGTPRVLHLLALRRGIRLRREAHAVRAVDHQLERDRLALLRLGRLREQLDRQQPRERAVGPGRVAEEMRAAGDDERAAAAPPTSQRGEGASPRSIARATSSSTTTSPPDEPRDARGKGGGRQTLHLHAAFRERGGDHGRCARSVTTTTWGGR